MATHSSILAWRILKEINPEYSLERLVLKLKLQYFGPLMTMCMEAKSPQSCLTLCNPMDCCPPGSSVCWDSPGKNTGVGCHGLLQGIIRIQRSNLIKIFLIKPIRVINIQRCRKPGTFPFCVNLSLRPVSTSLSRFEILELDSLASGWDAEPSS